ncbi:uncharacterized protein LOC126654541 [Mercurialis annua]|uniref:uncharacterized protein LOC126654541 n=1 Tax=Mercurialis annua TaxID=3986 RepID=UPI00215ED12E|nr:uncharacterized protein LOC126654541 [Mercurialis annua]
MSGDNFTEAVPKKRAVLGDVTNRPLKRGFSSISDDLGVKSRDGYARKVVSEGDRDSLVAKKKVCLGVENSVNEKCKQTINVSSEKGLFLDEESQSRDSSHTDTDNESKETSNMLESGVNLLKNVGEFGDASRDDNSCESIGSMSSKKVTNDDNVNDGGEGGLFIEEKQSNSGGHVCTSVVDKDPDGIKLGTSGQCGTVEWPKLPMSRGSSRSFELDRCTALKRDGCANLSAGADLLKACSCSFCLKAAYIWADLNYQDVKGRIAALKKSQKETSILVNKYARGKQTDVLGQANSGKSSQLESDLTSQWRSLFHHMEDIFVHESNQLQGGFVALKDLREHCKMDLEKINETPSDKY